MWTRNPALEIDRAVEIEADEALHMDQDEFRVFYEQTARSVWLFLARRSGDRHLADDLLQETYYRFLRSPRDFESDAHRSNYLFRIASNLANDALRKRRDRPQDSLNDDERIANSETDSATRTLKRTDLHRAMAQLSPRQRDALWLAYAEGSSHEEIAEVLGMKKGSIKLLLFRARRKAAEILRGGQG